MRCSSGKWVALLLALGALPTSSLEAQDSLAFAGPRLTFTGAEDAGSASPWWTVPVASALLPGAGQLVAGQHHGVLYLFTEVILASRFFADRSQGRRERRRFRELALTVARASFNPAVPDTAFQYFEQMEKFIESGPFDADPSPGLQPPTDERTFNGAQWALARQTFFTDPDGVVDPTSSEYLQALAFYRRRAVGPNFRWSWRNAGLEQDLFRQAIDQSDDAFRRATQELGFLLVNHLVSTLDAFISQRLSRSLSSVSLRSQVWTPNERSELETTVVLSVAF